VEASKAGKEGGPAFCDVYGCYLTHHLHAPPAWLFSRVIDPCFDVNFMRYSTGCEHLARLFVKLPDLLAHTPMGANEMKLLQNKLAELLRWLARFPDKFNVNYKETDRAYHEKV
jgi:hypothetical protein